MPREMPRAGLGCQRDSGGSFGVSVPCFASKRYWKTRSRPRSATKANRCAASRLIEWQWERFGLGPALGILVLDDRRGLTQPAVLADRQDLDAAAAVVGDQCVAAGRVDDDMAGPAPPEGCWLSSDSFPLGGSMAKALTAPVFSAGEVA